MHSCVSPRRALLVLLPLVVGCRNGPAPEPAPQGGVPAPAAAAPASREVITVRNAARLERVASLDVPGSFIGLVTFLPDGRSLVTGDRNGEVLFWETGTWTRRVYQAARSTREADDSARVPFSPTLALSPDGRTLAGTTNAAGDVAVRDVAGRAVSAFSYGSPVYATAISPDARLVAAGGLRGNVAVHELATGRQVADLRCDREYVSVLAFSPDGRTLVAGYERPGNLMKAWSTGTWQESYTFYRIDTRTDYHDAVFTADGGQLLIARIPADIELVDLGTREVVRRFVGHDRAAYQLALSPDGSLLASAADDGTVRLWEMATGNAVRVIELGERELYSVAFSPDGRLLAFSVSGEGAQVWAVAR